MVVKLFLLQFDWTSMTFYILYIYNTVYMSDLKVQIIIYKRTGPWSDTMNS